MNMLLVEFEKEITILGELKAKDLAIEVALIETKKLNAY